MKRGICIVFGLGAVLLGGCVALPRDSAAPTGAPVAGPSFPARIAVLPVSNQAGSPDGAVILRYLAVHKLSRDLGYYVPSPDETDRTLRERTLSGPEIPVQVAIARQNPGILADWLGVDGLLHGELQEFNKAKLTVWERKQVKARFWLTDRQGKTLWQSANDNDQSGFGGGGTSVAALLSDSGIPPEILEKIRNTELSQATVEVVNDSFATFPKRP